MRGDIREGRFSIKHERASFISGTTKEVVRTVGNVIEWWFYDHVNTIVDDIYDVGSSDVLGGRRWNGPIKVTAVSATISQGSTGQNDRGFYNTDILRITLNMDVIEGGVNMQGSNSSTIPQLSKIQTNPDHYLLDRIVFRNEVFQPVQVYTRGIVTDRYTLITIECVQVNPEELVNDLQFQSYSNYLPTNPIVGYGYGPYGAGPYGTSI